MKGFFKIIVYIKPYKLLAFLNVLFNILSSFAELFSIALIVPFLKLLFNPNELIKIKPVFSFDFKSITNLFMYHLSTVITDNGPQAALDRKSTRLNSSH